MNMVRRIAMAAVFGTALQAGSSLAEEPAKFASDEYLIVGDTNRGGGEPMVAVNPKYPKNIIVVAMSTLNSINGQTPPASGAPRPAGAGNRSAALMAGLRTPNSTVMNMAISTDGGVTWTHREDPIRHGTHSRCADPVAAAGPDGALYVACINREPVGEYLATDAVSVSRDQGKTWSKPMMLIGNDRPYRQYAPGLKPIHSETISSPFDRPWVVIDQSNNTVYMFVAHGATGEPPRTQSYVIATRNDGKSWGIINSIDSPDYPQAGGGDASAANGVLAAAFVASKSPTGATCPCVLFGTSTNDGTSFTYHDVHGIQPGEGPEAVKLLADPSRPGHYVIMTQDAKHTELLVTQSEDSGKSWSPLVDAGQVAGATLTKSWINVGADGTLVTVWRSINPDKSYDVYSTLSHDGGKSFTAPLRVSHATSPPPITQRSNYGFGDDISDVVVQGDAAHMVWGDYRAGFQGTWYATVPLSAYSEAR